MTGITVQDLLLMRHVTSQRLDALLDAAVGAISTDTRTLQHGDAYCALRGAAYDGHAYIDTAFERGALLAIVSAKWHRANGSAHEGRPLIIVRDTLDAYGDIARLYRSRHPIPVLAITGSNGKTTTKELIAAVLATKYRVLQTEGNLNNQIGLPRTLLRLAPEDQVAVVEMGTNQPGDIPALCAIAQQTHALVTNIGRAHIERLRSREGIAVEKGSVYQTLPRDGIAIVNADEPLLRAQIRRGQKRITFGTRAGADIRITDVTLDRLGCPTVRLSAPKFTTRELRLPLRMHGYHAAMTAAAALAAGFAFRCPLSAMRAVILQQENVTGRGTVRELAGVRVIDDTYNANPDSTLAALATLANIACDGRRIAVLGDMLELGSAARREHRALGEQIAGLDIPYLLTFGPLSKETARGAAKDLLLAEHFGDKDMLLRALDALVEPGDTVLVKGSRGMNMEEIVSFLAERSTERTEGN